MTVTPNDDHPEFIGFGAKEYDDPAHLDFLAKSLLDAAHDLTPKDWLTFEKVSAWAFCWRVMKPWVQLCNKEAVSATIESNGVLILCNGSARALFKGVPTSSEPNGRLTTVLLNRCVTNAKTDPWIVKAVANPNKEYRAELCKAYGDIATDGARIHFDSALDPVQEESQKIREAWAGFTRRALLSDSSFTANVKGLQRLVKGAKAVNKDEIRLRVNGKIEVSATSEETGDYANSLTCYHFGKRELDILINPRFVLDALGGMKGEVSGTIALKEDVKYLYISDGQHSAAIAARKGITP